MSFTGLYMVGGRVEINGQSFDIPSGSSCTIRKGKVYINGVEHKGEASDEKAVSVNFFGCTITKPVLDTLHSASFTDCSISDMKIDSSSVVVDGSIQGKAKFDSCSVQVGGDIHEKSSFDSCSVAGTSAIKGRAKRSRTASVSVLHGTAFQSGGTISNVFL